MELKLPDVVPQVEQAPYVTMDNGNRFYLWVIGIAPSSQTQKLAVGETLV